MILNDLMTGPPGNWKYTQPETGWTGTAITFLDLVRKVSQHRSNMNLPQPKAGFESLAAEVEDAICHSLSEADQKIHCREPNRVIGPRPGNMFSAVIHKITGRYALTCGECQQRMHLMNQWGWWKCWKNRQIIQNWLVQEAEKRGHRVTGAQMLDLFRAAWREIHSHRKSLKS